MSLKGPIKSIPIFFHGLVLQKCVFAYNSSKQSTTRYSPFYLMYWRNPVLPNENAFGETANTLAKYVEISSD
jgi:hypothetical protein